MPPRTVQTLAHYANTLRTHCATTPGLSVYQPLATSLVELCNSVDAEGLDTQRKFKSLVQHAVKRTAAVIENEGKREIIHDEARLGGLDAFENALDLMRRYIECSPTRDRLSLKARLGFFRDSTRFKLELDRSYRALVLLRTERSRNNLVVPSTITTLTSSVRGEDILELATLGTRAAGAILDLPVPVFNLLKPVVGLAALICETAKTVNSNRKAATDLAQRVQDITKLIVSRATALHDTGHAVGVDSLAPARLALSNIHIFLETLHGRRRSTTAWLFAIADRDRFAELGRALENALLVFLASQVIENAEIAREGKQELDKALAKTGRRVEDVRDGVSFIRRDVEILAMSVRSAGNFQLHSLLSFIGAPLTAFFF